MVIYRLHSCSYMKLHDNNNIYNCIHNCCHTPNITNDKEEAVQHIYLSIDTMGRQQCSTVIQYYL